jgi:hypothetical protein
VGVALIAGRDSEGPVASPPDSTLGSPAVVVAPPLIALDVPGWRLERFSDNGQGSTRYSEYGFTNDVSHLQVSFYGGGNIDVRTRGEQRETIDFNGRPASLLDYGAPTAPGTYRLDLVDGMWIWEFNGDAFADRAAFLDLAAHVAVVDEATWKATLPPEVVTNDQLPAAINNLLVGIPLPPSFPVVSIDSSASDPYQLMAAVTGKVFCAWLRDWDTALDNGDTAGADAAVQAIQSSHRWPALNTPTSGDWNMVMWSLADRVVAGDRSVVSGAVGGLGCAPSPGDVTTPTVV